MDVDSTAPINFELMGDTVSETPTCPIEEDGSQITSTSMATTITNTTSKKYQSGTKQSSKMPKTNIFVDCYHTNLELLIPNNAIGRDLFEQVVVSLALKEVWFFGLELDDSKKSPVWLKLKKKVFTQDVGKKRPVRFKLKPKFYPEDVEKELVDDVARKLFLEHIKTEIVSERIFCPVDTAVLLASFALQEQHGNYNAVLNPKGFLGNERVLPPKVNETYELSPQDWEEKIVKLYKDHRGMSKEQTTMEYLRIAQDLEMFGVNYFKIKNKKSTPLWLGVDALGINVYEKNNKLEPKTGFPWSEVKAISYRDRRFTIKPIYDDTPNFVFYTDKAKINKSIIILCMGNHELFIRRRKIDVAPKARISSSRLVDFNTIIEEEPPQSISSDDPMTEGVPHVVNGYGNEYENDDEVFGQYEEPGFKSESNTQARTSQGTENQPIQHSPTRKSSSSPVRHISLVRERSISPARQSSAVRNSEEPEYATVERVAGEDGVALVHARPPTPPAQRPTSDEELKEMGSEGSKLNQASSLKQNSVYESVNTATLSTLTEVPDRTSVTRDSDTGGEGSTDGAEMNRGSREYGSLREKYEQGMLSDEYYDREVYVNENKEMYYKLKHLFEDVSTDPSKLSEDELVHLKLKNENIDKYQTLRKIRSGYASDRIAIFEAMM